MAPMNAREFTLDESHLINDASIGNDLTAFLPKAMQELVEDERSSDHRSPSQMARDYLRRSQKDNSSKRNGEPVVECYSKPGREELKATTSTNKVSRKQG